MPCRRPGEERLLLLERAAAVSLQTGGGGGGSSGVGSHGGSSGGDVDALVAKLGEVLQLGAQNRTPTAAAAAASSSSTSPHPRLLLAPKHHSRDRAAPYSSPRGLAFLASLHRPPTTTAEPPRSSESPRVAKQLCGRGWLRSADPKKQQQRRRRRRHLHPPHPHLHYPLLPHDEDEDEEEDDPHRLLQQLILSGNLIKEAVRRLQLAAAEARSSPMGCSSSSSSSASSSASSSVGSCCCHSSSGEGDSAALPVSALPALP